MQMLATCRIAESGKTVRRQSQGFSLIELSVVLVLVALATSLVVPNLAAAYRTIEARSQLETIIIRLSSLSYDAYTTAEPISLQNPQAVARFLEVPPAWRIVVTRPVQVTAQGFCLGGELSFQLDEFMQTVILAPPFCKVSGARIEE